METAPNLNQAADWDRLIEAVGQAALLVTIGQRLSSNLRNRITAEDVLQEALLHAWRDRKNFEWRGLRSFRSWLLTIIDNRIHDLAVFAGAQKRAAAAEVALPQNADSTESNTFLAGLTSTTPSRVAIHREQAAAMQAALADLPDDQREVVRLRLFEHCTMEEIAGRLKIGLSAARHRFRAGAAEYNLRLRAALASHPTTGAAVEFAPES